jgi:hypothetical protein
LGESVGTALSGGAGMGRERGRRGESRGGKEEEGKSHGVRTRSWAYNIKER